MTFISYAQNYEDVTLYRALKHVEQGFYIDVGAQDPLVDSVTKAFYDRGWRGINLEPVGYWFQKLLSDRPEDYNLNLAASSEAGIATLYEVVETGLSTMDKNFAVKHAEAGFKVREIKVPACRLDAICDELNMMDVHFLKIDVEGAEGKVLAGMDLRRFRPWIILIEATEPNSTLPTHGKWEKILTTNHYVFVYFDGLNRYYVPREREEHLKEALSTPPNYFDHFIRYSEWLAGECVQGMEAEMGAMRQHLGEIENELARSRSQNETMRENLDTDRQRIVQFLSKLKQSRERIKMLEQILAEARERLDDQKQELIISQARSQWLEKEWNDSKAKIKELNDPDYFYRFIRYSEWRTGEHAQQMEAEAADACRRLQEMESELAASQTRAQWLENEWTAAKVKIDELNQHCHHWWTMADGLNRDLQTMYASRSWRVTEPLRLMKRLMTQRPHIFTTGRALLTSVPYRLTCGLRRRTSFYIDQHLRLKFAVSTVLAPFLNLKARLKSLAHTHEPMPLPIVPIQSSISDTPGESSLTPYADRIYTHLVVAIKKTKGKD